MNRYQQAASELTDIAGAAPVGHLVRAMHISLKNNFVYAATAKCGCSTIKKTLIRLELEDDALEFFDPEDIHRREFSPFLTPLQIPNISKFLSNGNTFRFCFSRHPFERILSAYLDKIVRNKPEKAQIMAQLGKEPNSTEQITFAAFVDAVVDQPVEKMDPHWRTQYHQTFQDKISYDFIGRVERLETDLLIVGEKLGVDIGAYYSEETRHMTNARNYIGDFFTTDIRRKVAVKYAIDFEYFAYDA
jgi:hypothetical protein